MDQKDNSAAQNNANYRYQPSGNAVPETGMLTFQPIYGLPILGVVIFVNEIKVGELNSYQGLKIKVRAGDHQIGMQTYIYNKYADVKYSDLQIAPNDEKTYAVCPVFNDYMFVEEPVLLGDPSLFQTRRVSTFSPTGDMILRRFYKNSGNKIAFFDWGNKSFPTALRCVFSNDLTRLSFYLDRSLQNLFYTSERKTSDFRNPLEALGNFELTRYNGETIGYIQQINNVIYIIKPNRVTKIGAIFLTQIEKNLLHNRDFGLKYLPTGQAVAYVQWQSKVLAEYHSFSTSDIRAEDEELMVLAFVTFTTTFFEANALADFAPQI